MRAALYAFFAAVAFAAMSACVRGLSPGTPGIIAVAARSLVGLAVALSLHRLLKIPLMIHNKPVLAVRVISGTISLICFFEAMRRLDMATVTLLNYLAPIYVSLLAWIILAEPLRGPQIIGLPLGLLGAIIVSLQQLEATPSPEALILGLAASVTSAIAYLSLRVLGRSEHPLAVVTAFAGASLIVALPPAIMSFERIPEGQDLALLIGAGLFGAIGQLLLTAAYRLGSASRIAILTLVQVPIAILFSSVFFSENLSVTALAGAALVVMGALLQVKSPKTPEESDQEAGAPDADGLKPPALDPRRIKSEAV